MDTMHSGKLIHVANAKELLSHDLLIAWVLNLQLRLQSSLSD